jgi:hypothetical protein
LPIHHHTCTEEEKLKINDKLSRMENSDGTGKQNELLSPWEISCVFDDNKKIGETRAAVLADSELQEKRDMLAEKEYYKNGYDDIMQKYEIQAMKYEDLTKNYTVLARKHEDLVKENEVATKKNEKFGLLEFTLAMLLLLVYILLMIIFKLRQENQKMRTQIPKENIQMSNL